MKKFERFKNEKIAVNVRSQKQYDDFMKMCEERGLKWRDGDLPTKDNQYKCYKENTCIDLNNLTGLSYCDIDSCKNYGYKIITYKDFMKEESNQFTKSDLKDNHIVIFESGHKRLWGLFISKDNYKENLTPKGLKGFNITEVYEFDKLVWKREESILDDKEKEWLNHFIKSTNITVNYIAKYENVLYNNREYLEIDYNNSDDSRESIRFPYFKEDTMYKGMELDKKYTLEELGLED